MINIYDIKNKKIKITLIKSLITVNKSHIKIIKALGLNKNQSEKIHIANDSIIGMIKKINYLIKIEEVKD